jgi:Mannosyltransferase (PIG-V)
MTALSRLVVGIRPRLGAFLHEGAPVLPGASAPRRSWKRDLLAVLPAWVLTRLVVVGSLGFSHVVYNRFEEQNPGLALREPVMLHDGLVAWDGTWYRDIARGGYDATSNVHEGLRFFPLWPLLGKVFSYPFGGNTNVSLVVLANVIGLALLVALYRFVALERGVALAARSVWLLSIAPLAFVLVLAYSEALSMTLTVLTFWALRTRRWRWASLFGFLVGLARPFGLLLAVPAFVEGMRGFATSGWRDRLWRLAPVVAPAAGCSAYLLWVKDRYGSFLLPFRIQSKAFGRGFELPWARWWRAFTDGVTGNVNEIFHAGWVVALAVMLVVLARRWPSSYTWFCTAVLLVAVSADNINSLERYCLSAFPFVVAAAEVSHHRRLVRWHLDGLVAPLAVTGLTVYSVLTFVGGYVP